METQDESFGQRLRQLREAAGLTQEGLAEKAGLSANAIAVLERGERRRPYPNTVRTLADALGLSAEDREGLLASVPRRVAAASPTPTPPDRHTARLVAPPTELVGRDGDVAAIGGLLSGGARLVTLTGPGGVGKTRLALAVAVAAGERFADGVASVSLSPLTEADMVVPTVAHSLGLREIGEKPVRDALHEHLRDRRVLLLLDNFEHVLAASGEVAALLASCPEVAVLSTSRSPLRLRGEREYPVSRLAVPDLGRVPAPDEVASAPSARLFLERAREVSPGFELTRANAAAVAAICRRLDGLPLALELAAARVRLLSPTTLLARLDHALPLLTGGARDLPDRQRTMRAAIGWSYDLLSPDERALFRHLAVFSGGWDLEAAEVVGVAGEVAEEDVLDLLSSLVEQSLILAEPMDHGPTRYRMLEPVREYAREELETAGELAEVATRHLNYFLALAEQADREMWGEYHGVWTARLEAEYGNLRAALGWAMARGKVEMGLRLTYALWKFIRSHGHLSEMRRSQEQLLAGATDLPPGIRSNALWLAGDLAGLAGDYKVAVIYLEESHALAFEINDRLGAAKALYLLGNVAEDIGDVERETVLYEEALTLFRNTDDSWWTAEAKAGLGRAARKRGDHRRARALHEEALGLQQNTGNTWGVAWGMTALAELAADEDRPGRAAALFGEGLQLHVAHGEHMGAMYCLLGLGKLAAGSGLPEAAALMLGSAESLREAQGLSLPRDHRPSHDTCVARLRAELSETQLAALWAEGRVLPLEQLVDKVLALVGTLASESKVTSRPPSPTLPDASASRPLIEPLSERERDVLRLLATELSGREIAAELAIAVSTVRTHTKSIFSKLDVTNRRAAVKRAAELALL